MLGIALLVASAGMLAFVEHHLTSGAADDADFRAHQIANRVVPDGSVVPVSDREDEFVQILDGTTVVASSANVEGRPVIALPRPQEQNIVRSVSPLGGQFVTGAARIEAPRGGRIVVVGLSLDAVAEARSTVVRALLIGVPVLLLVVGAVTWWIVGRALRPVEDMRAEVDRISSRELHRRVPVPRGKDEVARLAAMMNRMLDRLERGQERQRRFVSDASHELRSPVASIRQHVEVAGAHPDHTSLEELAEVVLEEDARLQRLVEDLLLLARLDESAGAGAVDEVDLDDVLFEEAARMRGMSKVEVDTQNVSAGRVLGNRSQLERLVRNLADNAIRHARESTALSLSQRDGHVYLSVDDDGSGIPPEERERVFERFVRLDIARGRETGGTGLGLSIVREVAAAHGGQVTIGESSLGGLRVEVRLPSVD
jgi:signal transduction histidine kinase